MSKKSRGKVGTTAKDVNSLKEGRLKGGFFFKDGKWRKINGGEATVSKVFAGVEWKNILIFNGETFDGDTLVSGIEY